jgi:uncharacterized protein (TIGR02453 family)
MAFAGWTRDAVAFFRGLEADNTRAYWTANRPVYDACVLAPMSELLAELAPEFGAGRIARPYRDVRFRADKSLYKTAIYATLEGGGYVRFSAEGLTTGLGYYAMDAGQLERYRAAVADDALGQTLAEIVARLTATGIQVAGVQRLKGAPRGYPSDHPRVELLRNRGLIAWRDWPVTAWLGSGEARSRIADVLRTAGPLQRWLEEQVGTAEPDRLRGTEGPAT